MSLFYISHLKFEKKKRKRFALLPTPAEKQVILHEKKTTTSIIFEPGTCRKYAHMGVLISGRWINKATKSKKIVQ